MKKQEKNSTHTQIPGISEKGYLYLTILIIGILLVSLISIIRIAYGSDNMVQQYIDTLNRGNAVYFEFGSPELTEEGITVLNGLAAVLTENPDSKIVITGHTDNIGSERFNLELSQKRAESVKAYLMTKGINGERMEISAKGFSEPAADNLNDENRARNRRVEFRVSGLQRGPIPQEKTETFLNASILKRSSDTLQMDLSVRDTLGEPITNIAEEDISATLKWKTETSVDSVSGTPRLIPIDNQRKIAFTFTMDYSPSMFNGSFDKLAVKTEQIIQMEKAVSYFVNNMDQRYLAKFIKFGKVINVVQGFTLDRKLMMSAIKNGSFPREGTAVYKSVYEALLDRTYESNPSIIKTVIAFTDGEENSSGMITKDSIYRLSEEKGVKVYTVGLIIPKFHSVPLGLNSKAESDLLEIAQRTGGFYYWASDAQMLETIYRSIYDQIMKSYQLSIIWDKQGLPPKGTNVTAVLRININGKVRTIHKSYIMQ